MTTWKSSCNNLDRQLEQQRQELADIEQDSRQKQQDLGELRERLLNTQLQLDHSRKEIETLKQPAAAAGSQARH